ncbi:MAG: 3'-5' exonuclease, partial [Bacteroidales bacterium]|nr:3'-5' exonuclease [Bacteroidales bacterium]
EDILFIDIETVPATPEYSLMSAAMQQLWDKKTKSFRTEGESPADLYERAGIYAEFGKIICISAGFMTGSLFRLKSVYGDDEKALLSDFAAMVNRWEGRKDPYLCGHNGKEFDFPYIARRMVINRVKIPDILNSAGKKPWEVKHLDTMELWKFGEYKHFTSLALLAEIFDIPTPKDDIDGSMVASVYYNDKDIDRIVTYCEKDVLTTARVMMRFMGRETIGDDSVESLTRLQ